MFNMEYVEYYKPYHKGGPISSRLRISPSPKIAGVLSQRRFFKGIRIPLFSGHIFSEEFAFPPQI